MPAATVTAVFSSPGCLSAGLYLADIWVRPKWADGWAIVEAHCPLDKRCSLTKEAQGIGRHAGALMNEAMRHRSGRWEVANLVELIASEARFRGFDDIGALVTQVAWWAGGTTATPVADATNWPADAGAIWLGAALVARWAASVTGRPDADLYRAEMGELVDYALSSTEPDVALVSPMMKQAGVGVTQMLYTPGLLIGWTAIGRRATPQSDA